MKRYEPGARAECKNYLILEAGGGGGGGGGGWCGGREEVGALHRLLGMCRCYVMGSYLIL